MNDGGSPGHGRFGMSARLLLVFLLGLLPVFGFLVYWAESQRQRAYDDAAARLRSVLEDVAARHRAFHGEVWQTLELVALALLSDGGASASCDDALRDARERRSWMGNAWVIDFAGQIVCATGSVARAPGLDAEQLERLERSAFDITELRSDPGDGRHVLAAMRFPRGGAAGWLVVVSRIEVADLAAAALPGDLPADTIAMSLDSSGHIMAHSAHLPDLVGVDASAIAEPEKLRRADGEPLIGSLADGGDYVLISGRVPGWDATAVAGLDHQPILAASRRDLAGAAAIPIGLLALAFAIAGVAVRRLVLKPIGKVRDTALSIADGNFGRRVELHHGPREVRELARVFDSMADRLERMALTDQLTGIANRRHLEAHLAWLVRGARPFAVLAIDLDGFKPINDRFGHAEGDRFLRLIADRVSDCVAPGGYLARIGGDEFVAVLAQSDGTALSAAAIGLAERILEAIARPSAVGETSIAVSGSVGISYWPEDGEEVSDDLRYADRALYAAKATGRSRLVIFDRQAEAPVAG